MKERRKRSRRDGGKREEKRNERAKEVTRMKEEVAPTRGGGQKQSERVGCAR